MRIPVYVLHGAWNTTGDDGVAVLGVSEGIGPLIEMLDRIAAGNAKDYVMMHGCINVERGDRYYEATDENGGYAKFYITEHGVELSGQLMGTVSREMQKIYRKMDVETYLQNLRDNDGVLPWVYEYIDGNGKVMDEILYVFNKIADCNTSFNTTMEIIISNVVGALWLDDEKLEYLWKKFGGVMADGDGRILDDFLGFKSGTHKEEVLRWFDGRHSDGGTELMPGGVQKVWHI